MMTGAWKKDLEGLVVSHAKRSSRRPWVHVDSRGLHALKPNMTCNCSRSRRSSREAGGIGDMVPAMILWFLIRVFESIDFLLPLIRLSLLEVATMWDPDGLPAAYPFGHRHCTRQRGDILVRKNTRRRAEQTTCKV